ncbi:MerC domain-containing protein [uncultured Maricaulis sp.]|uniref:MerC domain-containing protein n=1 Tax=uncultured Maricaulis sp. TaxID=174710 RepID=UPI0030D897DB|tara:strand:- start:21514 stop:21972 length:459 start_codon:yes stop_codon:yes gene_type:complete
MMALLPKLNFGNGSLDLTGISLSAVCVAHCLVFPVAAAAAPMLAPNLGEALGASHAWHLGLLAIAAPVSLLALGWSVRSSRARWPILALGLLGLSLMAVGALHLSSQLVETIITLSGVTILAAAHLINWRSQARAGHDHIKDCGLCEHEHAA